MKPECVAPFRLHDRGFDPATDIGMASSDEFRILSPTAILGYGFPVESLRRGLGREPHAIAVDAGSVDPGPFYLGAGKPFVSRSATLRDLALLLPAARERDIPLIIGTAGGAGAKPHVDWTLEILDQVARDHGMTVDVGVIYTDVEPQRVAQALAADEITALDHAPALDEDSLAATERIVAQIGCPPVARALRRGFKVIVCGRAYDPAVFAAPAMVAGYPDAAALHMGKILECAAIAADPGSGRDCVLGTVDADGFTLETLSPARSFTDYSVAAHALYEKSDPYHLPGPEGTLDLTDVRYEALSGGRVRVTGSRLQPPARPCVKLEGARREGYRSLFIAGIRDPRFIRQLDDVIDSISSDVRAEHPALRIAAHVYGRDGVMGSREPNRNPGHEVGLVLEVLAETQEAADAGCGMLRSTLLHFGYPGRIATAGNLALPFSPSDISCGPCYTFSLYHLLDMELEQTAFEAVARRIG
jgi:hypothetical protein